MNDPKTIEFQPADFVESVLPATTLADLVPDALVDAIAEQMQGGARAELGELAAELGAPAYDSVCTVMSARAMLMAANRGRGFYFHELRGRIPMPDALFPEIEVWDEGTIPVWQDGVFVEPKYFSFRQDAPFAAYNPVHRRKWRPHELLHGAVGFFWRPDASRFETYVGSRLNELLPVVHWYGLDEIYRPRCDAHQNQILFREFCPQCEAAVRPYWEVEPGDRVAAIQHAHTAQEHFVREMQTCRDELRDGVAIESPRGRLNASTDAVGYLMGHAHRIDAPSFHTWVSLFLRDGLDYFSDIDDYADRVETRAARLVGGTVVTTPDRFRAQRQRRMLQDLGYRALLALEWLDPAAAASQRVERTVMDALERCSEVVDALAEADALVDADDVLEDLLDVLGDARSSLPDEVAEPLLALGLPFFERGRDRDWEIQNLATGIAQGAPLTAERVDAGHVETFAASRFFAEPGRLITRFAAYLRERAGRSASHAAMADLASLEAWAADDPHRDEHAERFAQQLGTLDGVDAQDLLVNQTMRRAWFSAAAVSELADSPFDGDTLELAAAYWRGEFHLVVLDPGIADALTEIENGGLPEDDDAVFALLEAGIVVYVPTTRRRAE